MTCTPAGIAFDRAGPRGDAPIVFLHAGVADRRMWEPLWPQITRARDCVRLDLRGFGESTTQPPGPLDHVGDVLTTLDHQGIGRCHLVGASFGAGVSVEVALTDAAVQANVDTWLIGPGRTPGQLDPELVEQVRVMQRRAFEVQAAWGEDVDEIELDPPALERLADIACPVLVLLGGHDLLTTHDAARRVVDGAPDVRRVDWSDAAHLPTLERADQFAVLLRGWVDRESSDRPH